MQTKEFELKKSWHWMLYIDLILPGILFLLAFLIGDSSAGHFLSQLFHSYNLYVLCPIPNFLHWIGIIGLLIPAILLVRAALKKDWADLLVCVGMEGLVLLYFWREWNYELSALLSL
ncbi:MAG: hypothetical protein PHD67_08565 [Oscillospiraceae bacterium]|nr:hypothetical protein [Oscillospiraceae bacterium]